MQAFHLSLPGANKREASHPEIFFFAGSKTLLNAKEPHQATAAVITEHELIDWRAHPLVRDEGGGERGLLRD